jgi:hypothetical protein
LQFTDQELELLATEIREAFKSRRFPTGDALVASDDPESLDVKRDFFAKPWNEIQDRIINHNYCSLPFFTPVSYCYYLPAYLVYSTVREKLEGTVSMFLLFSITEPSWLRRYGAHLESNELHVLGRFLRAFEQQARQNGDDDLAEDAAVAADNIRSLERPRPKA